MLELLRVWRNKTYLPTNSLMDLRNQLLADKPTHSFTSFNFSLDFEQIFNKWVSAINSISFYCFRNNILPGILWADVSRDLHVSLWVIVFWFVFLICINTSNSNRKFNLQPLLRNLAVLTIRNSWNKCKCQHFCI